MMDSRDEGQQLDTHIGLCHWAINQELLLRNEYLPAENRILRAHLSPRLRLTYPERSTLAEIGKRIGRKALKDVACVAKPDTTGVMIALFEHWRISAMLFPTRL
jgi:hypothetical protein